jgi:RimJ/RimL family protein N-acetyltransferase
MGGIVGPKDIESIIGSIEYFKVLNASGFFLKWSIRDKKTDSFLGEIELYPLKPQIRPWIEWAIGYSLKEMFRGKGYMSEAVNRVLDFAFVEKSVLRVKADVPEKNIKSLKLLRKNGFSYEGLQINKLFINGVFKNMSQLAITQARYFEGKQKHISIN